ncbi:MAG TPA: hypothetical protein VGR07_02945 [Thermoanaerobaculia bacterium]|nr:hypothetical protein [Thermoanaerobaculia bacterium]
MTEARPGCPPAAASQALSFTFALVPGQPDVLYAGTNEGLWRSVDGARSWSQTSFTNANAAATGLPANVEVRQLAIDPHAPNTLYAATAAGVFVTDNGGRRWSELNQGLLDHSVLSIAVDANDPRTLYAGTAGLGGLFVMTRE